MIATSDFLTAPECTEFVFGLGSAPDPAGAAYGAPPDPLAGLTRVRRKGEGKEEGEGGRRNCVDPSICIFCVRHCFQLFFSLYRSARFLFPVF